MGSEMCIRDRKVTVIFLVPPSLSPLALLKIVLETIPELKLLGAGEDDGLLVPVRTRIVLPAVPEIAIL